MGIGTGLAARRLGLTARPVTTLMLSTLRIPPSVERETGIEPASLAWKARVLPLNYSRTTPLPEPLDSIRLAIYFYLVEEAGFEPA